ncbi:hypothetical protein [Bacteriovorax sp. DB6_IX]|uniref:hypothetical protein n=1 Tax=Bacteriovorax sp. DB6_IX TaxID=1353530 RepID=UPI00038A1936|nr:hypothetical protein [Bacteriovorax sp. DB6_IX]EQC50546.1 hypothetical protein M901_2507 [Bacteriovorax sp. DB6_IX]
MKKLITALLLFTQMASGKTFTSNFTEFELPSGWKCDLEGSEWVCQSENKKRQKEAIIILAAKRRGKQDKLALYQAYLKQPKSFRIPGGKTQVSDPKNITARKIGDTKWVDALHLASEVPGFYTRYLAAVKGELGVAVTFSVAKDHYNDYKPIFDKIIETLKMFNIQKAVASGKWKKDGNIQGGLPGNGGDIIWDETDNPEIGVDGKSDKAASSGGSSDMMLILLVLAAAGIFFVIKKKKGGAKGKKKGKKKKKKKAE